MTTDRWRQIEDLFHSALDREPPARAVFLDEACRGDAALREQLEKLLASFAEAADFIERPVLADSLSSSAQPSESLIGQTIGNYEILRLLGAGGMGEVYLARDTRLDRQVALKLLPARFIEDPAQVKRFEREARAASALNHPNIITIYEIGREGRYHFIATEFIAGQTLREAIANGGIGLRDALGIVAQIAGALAAAHTAGIVHRDIKPENVMVRPDGLVKALDFGLAKPFTTERDTGRLARGNVISIQTDPGMLMGTLAYLSPEQARGERVDHRTDIFSLGVVLYEMLAGARPFAGESAADTLDAILGKAPAPITASSPGLPVGMDRILRRALEKDRDARYQSAERFRDDLIGLARELDAPASRRGAKWSRAAVPALIAAAIAVTGWIAWLSIGGGKKTAPSPFSSPSLWAGASAIKLTDQPGQELFPSLSPDGQFIVYASQAAGNWDIWRQRVTERASERQLTNLTKTSATDETQPSFSPDGQWIAFQSGGDTGGVFVMDVNGGQRRQVSRGGYHPSWSVNGEEIYCIRENVVNPENRTASARMVWAVTVATGEQRLIYTDDMAQPQASPNGRRIAYWGAPPGSTRRDIWTRPVGGGAPVAVTNDEAVDWNPVWSPDGRHLYFASDRGGSMSLWRVAIDEQTGRVLQAPEQIATPSNYSQHPAISRDGRHMAYVQLNQDRNLYRIGFDPARGKTVGEPAAITRGSRPADSPAISPDGQWIAFVSEEEGHEDIFVIKSDGEGEWRNLTKDAQRNRGPVWSSDGRRIAFYADYGGTWEIWAIDAGGANGIGLQQLTFTNGAKAYYPLWSPDASGQRGRLAFTQTGGKPSVIELAAIGSNQTPRPLIPASEPDMAFWPRTWSADGTRLAGRWRARDAEPYVLGVYSFESRQFQPLTAHGIDSVAWLNDDRRLLFVFAGKFFLLDTRAGNSAGIYSLAPRQIPRIELSRDNRQLVFSMEDRQADIWMLTQK